MCGENGGEKGFSPVSRPSQAHSEITVPRPFDESNHASWKVAVPTLTPLNPAPGTAIGSTMVIAPGGPSKLVLPLAPRSMTCTRTIQT